MQVSHWSMQLLVKPIREPEICYGRTNERTNEVPHRARLPSLKISGTPPTPLKKPILGGQKPKWAVSSKRVCVTVLKFYRGS